MNKLTEAGSRLLRPREKDILMALCENGCSTIELQKQFDCSRICIDMHIHAIYNKTGYSSRPELVANTLHKMYRFWMWMDAA